MFDSPLLSGCIFAIATFVVAIAGTRMAKVADRIADKTGLGEAIVGAVLLGGSTSLSGIVTSVTAAASGHPNLAVSNAVGGIAAQTAFLTMADIAYRRVNLEHAAASATNLTQGALLMTLLTIPLLASTIPGVEILQIHPASIALIAAYGFGLRLVSIARSQPMWGPKQTEATQRDTEDAEDIEQGLRGLVTRFVFLALVTGSAGFVVAQSGVALSQQTGLSESVVGGLFAAVSTSLPELVTSVAAVRQGALMLAVGDIIGGNSFDILFLAFADFAYRDGSIYRALDRSQQFLVSLTMLMTGILLLGLLRRQRQGIARIGFESASILLIYLGGFALLFFLF